MIIITMKTTMKMISQLMGLDGHFTFCCSLWTFCIPWMLFFSVIGSTAKNNIKTKNTHKQNKNTTCCSRSASSTLHLAGSLNQCWWARQEAADCTVTPVYLCACMGVAALPARRKLSALRGSRGLQEMEMRKTHVESSPAAWKDSEISYSFSPELLMCHSARGVGDQKNPAMARAAHSCRAPNRSASAATVFM